MSSGFSGGDEGTIFRLIGENLLTIVFSVILLGIVSCQAVLYFERFRDGRATQMVVCAALLLQAATVINTCQCMYKVLINVGINFAALGALAKWYKVSFIISVVQTAVVQSFFVWRVWSLSRTWWQTGIAATCVLAQMGLGFASLFRFASQDLADGSHFPLMIGWVSSEIFADFAIALIISLLLLSKKTKIGRTQTLLNKLIQYTISTGLITGLFSVLCLALYLQQWVNAALIIGPLYPGVFSLAMLANLHSRTRLQQWEQKHSGAIELTTRPNATSAPGLTSTQVVVTRVILMSPKETSAGSYSSLTGSGKPRASGDNADSAV